MKTQKLLFSLKSLITFCLILPAILLNAQYFTNIFGITTTNDVCNSGIQLSTQPGSGPGMISVGNSSSVGATNIYFLSVDNTGAINTATGCTTNGSYQLFSGGSGYNSNATDVAELDPSTGDVVITGTASYGGNISLLAMVMDYAGNVKCIKSYDLGAGVAEVYGNAVITNIDNSTGAPIYEIYITGTVKYLVGGSPASGLDLIVMKLIYSVPGGTPTLTIAWNDILDINSVSGSSISAYTYQEEGLDIMYNTSGVFNFGRLLVVGSATSSSQLGFTIEVNEATGAVVTPTIGTPSLNILHTPSTATPATNEIFRSVKYDYTAGSNPVFIGGQGINAGLDYTLTNLNGSGLGVINFSNYYDDGNGLDDHFSSLLVTSKNTTMTPAPRCYLTGYAPIGAGVSNDILLFELDNAGAFVTSAGATGASQYGNSGDEKGNDISEDISGTYLTLHNTTNGSYPLSATSDFDLVNIYYNAVALCDGNPITAATSTGATSVTFPGFHLTNGLSTYSYTYNCNTGNTYSICSSNTAPGGSNALLGINNLMPKNSSIKMYPSILPDNNKVFIENTSNSLTGTCIIEVTDGLGRRLNVGNIKTERKFEYCLGDNLSKGMYFVKITVNDESHIFKIFK